MILKWKSLGTLVLNILEHGTFCLITTIFQLNKNMQHVANSCFLILDLCIYSNAETCLKQMTDERSLLFSGYNPNTEVSDTDVYLSSKITIA